MPTQLPTYLSNLGAFSWLMITGFCLDGVSKTFSRILRLPNHVRYMDRSPLSTVYKNTHYPDTTVLWKMASIKIDV